MRNSNNVIKTIKVATINTHLMPLYVQSRTRIEQKKRIDAFAGYMADPNRQNYTICGLQEIWFESIGIKDIYWNRMNNKFQAANKKFRPYRPEQMMGSISGLGIQARFPMIKNECFPFFFPFYDEEGKICGGDDCWAMKGFQAVRYKVAPEVEIDVYNLHLQSGNYRELRDRQLRLLYYFLKHINTEIDDGNTRLKIVMGDFNIRHKSKENEEYIETEEYKELSKNLENKRGLIDVWKYLRPDELGGTVHNKDDVRLDYIFVTNPENLIPGINGNNIYSLIPKTVNIKKLETKINCCKPKVNPPCTLSDHYLVETEIDLVQH